MLDPILKSAIEIADRHASILSTALDDLSQWPPLSAELLSHDDTQLLRILDQIQSRFTKLQDHLGTRLFPALLDALAEDPRLPMIDRLNLLEKLGYIESADTWHDLRAVRNRLAHDYPSAPELLAAEVQQAVDAARAILTLWSGMKARILAHPVLRTLVSD